MPDPEIAAAIVKRLARFCADGTGLAAAEFAIASTLLAYGLLNAVDVGYYIYKRMEVENAADAGAQAATRTCDQNALPATTNCSGLNAAITAAIQNTSLGTAVALASGNPTEGYYCTDNSNVLQYVSSVSSKPGNCSGFGYPSASPSDYLQVGVTAPYQPLFGVGVMSTLGWTSIGTTSWMRMN